jgi:hypothetical protein
LGWARRGKDTIREKIMKTVDVTIEGLSALLQHRFGEQTEVEAETRTVKIENMTPADAAERTAYRDSAGNLFLPGAAIARLLREAGGSHKQRGSRKSLKYIVPAAVIVLADQIMLHNSAGTPLTRIEVDSRPIVIPSTKGRIMRHRARIEKWRASFSMEVDDTVLDVETIHQLLEEGGRRIGVGDYRPEKGGPYGRFAIIAWAVTG